MTRLKICVITRTGYAQAAIDEGADFIGVVFWAGWIVFKVEGETRCIKRQ